MLKLKFTNCILVNVQPWLACIGQCPADTETVHSAVAATVCRRSETNQHAKETDRRQHSGYSLYTNCYFFHQPPRDVRQSREVCSNFSQLVPHTMKRLILINDLSIGFIEQVLSPVVTITIGYVHSLVIVERIIGSRRIMVLRMPM